MSRQRYQIEIPVHTHYVADQSRPDERRFVFPYTIQIRNMGEVGARLMRRHWRIVDADGKVQEVRGEGVVGEQPHMAPGEQFEYTSGAVLETSVGSMRGSYQMLAESNP